MHMPRKLMSSLGTRYTTPEKLNARCKVFSFLWILAAALHVRRAQLVVSYDLRAVCDVCCFVPFRLLFTAPLALLAFQVAIGMLLPSLRM